MFKRSAMLFAAVAALSTPAFAMEYPPAYSCEYEVTTTGQKPMTMKTISDGKGKVKSISESVAGKTTSLMDYPAKQTTTIMEAQKMYMKSPMTEGYKDEKAMEKSGAKSLGTKTIDGHPCHGYETKSGPSTVDMWIGDDIHAAVLIESKMTGGMTSTTKLKSYSKDGSDVALNIPAGFKEMKMPGAK